MSGRPSPSPRRRSRPSTAARPTSTTGPWPRLRNASSHSTARTTPGRPPGPSLFSSRASALHAIPVVLLTGHALDHPTSLQIELRAFHVPRNRAVELPFELRLDRHRESVVREIAFPKHLKDRLLHRFILCPANVDAPLSLRVQRQDFLFHGAKGEDESYLDKSSCGFGGPALNNAFSGPAAIVAVESDADRLPSPRSDRNLLRSGPWR